MSRKRYSPEHIINILREAEVLISKAGERARSVVGWVAHSDAKRPLIPIQSGH